MVEIEKLIAAICPDVYCMKEEKKDGEIIEIRKKVKDIVKSGKGYLAAAKEAKLVEQDYSEIDAAQRVNPFKLPGQKNPVESHELKYEASGEALEPLYFWLIDNITQEYDKGIDKVIDNFVSSPGSAHFAEMGQRATRMQEEAMKIFGTANQIIKSILNIIYDLKEFEMRLKSYEKFHSSDKSKREEGLLSLKQIWIDSVDVKRGNSSIKGFAQQFDYVTLIDAFMFANTVEDVAKMDLNDRVKRIVTQRLGEFLDWVELSEKELKKRFEIEKIYLKSQVNSVRLYSRWVKPYLQAAKQLEQRVTPNQELVTQFNSSIFELVLLGKADYNPMADIAKGDLPKFIEFEKKREYSIVILLQLRFRNVPERTPQGGYGFRGKLTINFRGFALNEDELKVLNEEIVKDDLQELNNYIEGATTNSLDVLKDDLDHFLEEGKEKKNEEDEEKKKELDTNPFSALWGMFKSEKKKEDKKESKDLKNGVPEDSKIEQVIRSQAIIEARRKCRKFYHFYKKNYGMPAFPL